MNIALKAKKFVFGQDVMEGKAIYKTAFSVAWPSILESFLTSLTGFFDTIMVSALGVGAIASVSLATQPKFLGLAIFIALGVSISSLVARRRGENDRESANRVVKMALLISVLLIGLVSVIFIVFANQIIEISGSEPETHDDAVSYLRIIMAGIGFNALNLIINAAQRGSGNTRIAMITNVSSNAVNVLFNYLLISGNWGFPALGVNGAAIATVIGTGVGFVLSVISICRKNSFIYIKYVKGFIPTKKDIQAVLKVGSSALMEQVSVRIGFILFAITVANLGTTILAAHQIGSQFMSLSFAFADGLAIASVALVGRSLGQKDPVLAKKYSVACQKIGILFAVVISLIFAIFGRSLFKLFSDEPEVLDLGVMIMWFLVFVIYVQIIQITIMGSLRGAGDAKYTAMISLLSVTLIRPAASWILCYPLGMGLAGVWLGMCIDQTLRLILSYLRFRKGHWLQIKL